MVSHARRFTLLALLTVTCIVCAGAADQPTADSKYPRLSAGPVRHAVLSQLPAGMVATVEGIEVTGKALDVEINKQPKELRGDLTKYPVLMLDSILTDRLLTKEAKEWASINRISGVSDEQIIQRYLGSIVADVKVTDAQLLQYFKDNRQMFGDATYEQTKDSLRAFLEDEKRMDAADKFIKSVGTRHLVKVSSAWIAKQYPAWQKTPIEQKIRSGKPTIVNFYGDKCEACKRLAPILEQVRKEYAGKANILPLNVAKYPVLSIHYGIRPIPAMIFFDKKGKEVFRHVGVWTRDAIKKKLGELGA